MSFGDKFLEHLRIRDVERKDVHFKDLVVQIGHERGRYVLERVNHPVFQQPGGEPVKKSAEKPHGEDDEKEVEDIQGESDTLFLLRRERHGFSLL
jgi:hypothetical protein